MTKTYEKVVDLIRDNTYPIHPTQINTVSFNRPISDILQKVVQCKPQYPLAIYELEYINGISLHDVLVRNLTSSDLFIQDFNNCIKWYLKNCILYFDEYLLMLNGDFHPGNIILTPNNEFKIIDYLSDFLVLTKDKQRIYLGFLNFLKRHEDITSTFIHQLELPDEIKEFFVTSLSIDVISDLSDELVVFSRDQLIKNKLNHFNCEWNIKFEKILNLIKYDLSKDIQIINELPIN